MVWHSHLLKSFPQFVVIHTVKGFGIVNKAEVHVFLKFSCFFNDSTDVGNLISGSCGFSKSSFNIWKFMVHVLLKPGLENFEHYLASVWDEYNRAVVWAFLALSFFEIGMKTDIATYGYYCNCLNHLKSLCLERSFYVTLSYFSLFLWLSFEVFWYLIVCLPLVIKLLHDCKQHLNFYLPFAL